MKKQAIINFVLICILSLLPLATRATDKVISIKQTLSGNTDVYVFDGEISAKSIRASGIATFPGFTGYVRILLTDTYGLDYLVYESTPLVATDGRDDFTDKSEETPDVSQIASAGIRVEISNASLDSLTVTISDQAMQLRSSTEKEQLQMERVGKINGNLERMNALWRAGNTEVSRLSYEEKKSLFGGQLPDLGGFEYYVGGVFEIDPSYLLSDNNTSSSESEELYVKEFDWRKRHGADKPSSPYYNSGGSGWMTPVQSQNCGSCWAFAAIGALEAAANVYFNRYDSGGKSLLNLDLSEQEILACSMGGCNGAWADTAYDYIQKNGVGDEESLPVARPGRDDNCDDRTTRQYTVRIPGYTDEFKIAPKTDDELKSVILDSSPCYMSVSAWRHALVATGYRILSEGDSLTIQFNQNGQIISSEIILQAGDPRIGRAVVIIKNSWDTGWGENGYGYLLAAGNELKFAPVDFPVTVTGSMNLSGDDVMCEDRDGDGYYFWGTGPKPAHCPECPDDPDSDDSDSNIGSMSPLGKTIPVIYGKEDVSRNIPHVYTYLLPFKVTEDTYIPIELENPASGVLSANQLYIRKGRSSANFSVTWTSNIGTNTKIVVGEIKKEIRINTDSIQSPVQAYSSPQLYPHSDLKISYTSSGEHWYIPGNAYGDLIIGASYGNTDTFIWSIEGVDYKYEEFRGGSIIGLNYNVLKTPFEEIKIQVRPEGYYGNVTKTLVIKRTDLKLSLSNPDNKNNNVFCPGDIASYTIEGFDDLPHLKQAIISWSGEGSLTESEMICGSFPYCVLLANENGYGKGLVTIRLPIVNPEGEPILSDDGGLQYWDETMNLESEVWVGPNTGFYTEIDGKHIIKTGTNTYRLVPESNGVDPDKGLWDIHSTGNNQVCFIHPTNKALDMFVKEPEGQVIEVSYSSNNKCNIASTQKFRFTDPNGKNMKLIRSNINTETPSNICVGDKITYKIENAPSLYNVEWVYNDNLKLLYTTENSAEFKALQPGKALVTAHEIKINTDNDNLYEEDYCYYHLENQDVTICPDNDVFNVYSITSEKDKEKFVHEGGNYYRVYRDQTYSLGSAWYEWGVVIHADILENNAGYARIIVYPDETDDFAVVYFKSLTACGYTSTQQFTIFTGFISEMEEKKAMDIQENIQSKHSIVKTNVYSLTGILIYSSDANIDELNLSNGIYIIEKINDEGVIIRDKININK